MPPLWGWGLGLPFLGQEARALGPKALDRELIIWSCLCGVGVNLADLGMGHSTPALILYLDLGAHGPPPATASFESFLEPGASIPMWAPRTRWWGAHSRCSAHRCVCAHFLLPIPFFLSPFLSLPTSQAWDIPPVLLSLLKEPRERHSQPEFPEATLSGTQSP